MNKKKNKQTNKQTSSSLVSFLLLSKQTISPLNPIFGFTFPTRLVHKAKQRSKGNVRQRSVSESAPGGLANSGRDQPKQVDIMQMLSKAQDEYNQVGFFDWSVRYDDEIISRWVAQKLSETHSGLV